MLDGLPHIRVTKPQRERYSDLVYGQLLEQIASGTFNVGMRMPSEKELSELFGVSRPVIRQALTRLQADGVVVSRKGSGTILRKVPPKGLMEAADGSDVGDILRSFEARIALEAATAKFAAIRKTEQDIERLERAMANFRKEFDTGAIRPEFDLAVHQAIAEASNNRHLIALFFHLVPMIDTGASLALSFTRLGSKERAQRILDEHERIFDAIMDGDGDSASVAMIYHLDQARRRLIDGSRSY